MVIAKLCKLLNKCMYQTVSEYTRLHPEVSSLVEKAEVVKLRDFIHFSKDSKFLLGRKVLRAHGYLEELAWWVHNKNFVHCIAITSGSCLYCFADIAEKSLSSLLPGWFRNDVLKKYQSSTILPSGQVSFDVGVHLRNQLHHFEKNEDPSTTKALQANIAYASSKLSKSLIKNIVEKIERHYHKNATVYISSDNEDVKDLLASALISKGFRVFRLSSDGIVHSKSSKTLNSFTETKGFFDLLLDWKCLVLSETLYAWRNVKPKFAHKLISTFAKSTKIASNKRKAYVLLDAEKVDTSSKNWKSF